MPVRYYDISRSLAPSTAVWPGDTPFDKKPVSVIGDDSVVNVVQLTLSSHFATHVDAPFHFESDGATMEQVPLEIYWGPAQVISVSPKDGSLLPADLAHVDVSYAPRLLIHSAASERDQTVFHPEFVYPHPDLGPFLAARGVVLFGTDAPSVDKSDSKTLPGHRSLNNNGIYILEGLDLSAVPDGLYELSAFPLRITGCDGSPVRAVLRSLD